MPPSADTARLCERCGYRLAELPDDGPCPECGLPIAQSIPERRRPGSPWQRGASITSWLATGVLTLTTPPRLFDRMRIEATSARSLFWINTLAASVPLPTAMLLERALRDGNPSQPTRAGLALAVVLVLVPLLTWIETLGLRTFGRQRRWRITPDVAWTVCAHASFGWVLAGWLLAGGFVVGSLGLDAAAIAWLDQHASPWLAQSVIALVRPFKSSVTLLVAGFVGMLAFECLVYVGVRRCRFANPPTADHPAPPAATSAPAR
jgi:hypothetical protein